MLGAGLEGGSRGDTDGERVLRVLPGLGQRLSTHYAPENGGELEYLWGVRFRGETFAFLETNRKK